MKRFIYIITDRNRNNLHVGLCSDILKAIQFYGQMPTLFFDSAQQLNRLVYFEEINTEEQVTINPGRYLENQFRRDEGGQDDGNFYFSPREDIVDHDIEG